MRQKILIFLDIDGTLLGPGYKENSGHLPRLIRSMSKKGYLFCLNSNRAKEDLVPLVKKFSINGPVIAENGTYWFWKDKQVRLLSNAKPIKGALKVGLADLAASRGAFVDFADTVGYEWDKLKKVPLAWVVNDFRIWTASIHVRTFGRPDIEAAKKLARGMKKGLSRSYTVATSDRFANVLVSPSSADKGKAILELQKKIFPKSKLIMIGDDEADIVARKAVDGFYAVSNATREVKQIADFVSKKAYTRGVVDILDQIDRGRLLVR